MKTGLKLIHKEIQDIDDLADDFTQSLFSPEYKERKRIEYIEKAIELSKENERLKRNIIELSLDNPKFLCELKNVLDRLGL